MKKHFSTLAAFSVIMLSLTSCSNDDDEPMDVPGLASVTFNTNATIQYSSDNGAWVNCYDPTMTNALTYTGLNFSHQVSEYAGEYYWSGFCPSNSTEYASHPDDYLDYQWSSITGGGLNYAGSKLPFLVANWNTGESLETIPANPSLKMMPSAGGSFRPNRISITNSSYTYYNMRDGIGYGDGSDKFTSTDDFLKVYFIGVRNGYKTGTVTASLANGTQLLSQWVSVNLQPLGEVDYIYCQMESSKANEWGMLTPAYFCVGDVIVFAQ
ncbi:MAG: hypothetical protein C7K11_04455 [Candidatus Amulumruptor caecigallinarius]|nr:MAG: hypothetical protein C7K11_04455 [Candidatus Amulumruptor caecigallinarius]